MEIRFGQESERVLLLYGPMKNNWYGPAGIGANRGIDGFRHWHQIPFLRAMPDRKLDAMGDLMSHWVAQGNYVCETGWPNMRLTLTDEYGIRFMAGTVLMDRLKGIFRTRR